MSGAHSSNDAFRAKEEEYYRELWSRESWGSVTPNPDEKARSEKIVSLIREYVLPAAGDRRLRILDLGCGRGWLTNILSALGEVVGIDPVSAGVERARALFPNIEFRCLESAELQSSLGLESFDLVVSSEVIEHVDRAEQPAFLTGIFSLLVPGGFAVLTTPRGEMQERWARCQTEEQPREEWLMARDLRRLAEEAGFNVRRTDRVFVPMNLKDPISVFVQSRYFAKLAQIFPASRLLARLRYSCSIYQVILLQRPAANS
jgi:2-polyprenyl-3-methyl-5-hydroxy-6-metoxy-1,4-benzoquinol methylase